MLDATENREYFLALRTTTEAEKYATGLRVNDLALAINRNAAKLRAIIILDCCYAGEAVRYFTGGDPVADPSSKTPFGLTLFTASPSRQEAAVPPGEKRTMFSECLLDVLDNGIPGRGPLLSIKEISDQVRVLIVQRYPDDGVRPEIHSPRQRYGDVADYPLFPNVASLSGPKPREMDAVSFNVRLEDTDVLVGSPADTLPAPSTAPSPQQAPSLSFFLADAGLASSSGMIVLACAVIENPGSVREAVENARRRVINDTVLDLDHEARERLERTGFDYPVDDPDVRSKFIETIATLTYEAYTCAASRVYFSETSEERILSELFGRLLFDRISKHKSERIEIVLRNDRADLIGALEGVASSCVHAINSKGRGQVRYQPIIRVSKPKDGCIELARYVAAVVCQRIDQSESVANRRDYRRIASKVRLIRRLDTGQFFSRHRPLPD